MSYDLIQVGTGGRGAYWCEHILPANVEKGLVNVVAAVDQDPDVLENAQEHLDVDPSACYTDAETAFEEVDADFCTVVVPPWVHEDIVDAALAHDLHILSEKPIADTLEASVRIAEKVNRAGVKMGVTMSHRFDRDKTSLRRRIRSGEYGPVDYLVNRFTCSLREYGAWGAFRHDMEDPLLMEGAVHQLDFLADMAGAKCDRLYAETWNPAWGEYDGDSQALVTMHFENGVRATYEGAKTNATGLNCWGQDYVRAECRDATLILDQRELECHPHDEATLESTAEGAGESIPLDEQDAWADVWLVQQFVDWLDGGEPMATNVEDNLQSMALVEAAIESGQTGKPVAVQELLAETREQVSIE